jgi:predicted lipoprotein
MYRWKVPGDQRLAPERPTPKHLEGGAREAVCRGLWISAVVLGALAIVLGSGCEVRPLDPDTGRAIIDADFEAFDAESFVEEYWSERIIPTIQRDAVDLGSVLAALRGAHEDQTSDLSREAVIIHGRGLVLALDESSQARRLLVDLPPFDGLADVGLQIGPVIRGTALRDAMDFISFDQFVNQLEYASVARALHDRLRDTVLDAVDAEALVGQEITFYGVLTARGSETPLVTPTQISIPGR